MGEPLPGKSVACTDYDPFPCLCLEQIGQNWLWSVLRDAQYEIGY